MPDINKLTVTIHFDIDLNGEAVTHVLEMPATWEGLDKKQPGMTLHLHLDAAKLAEAIYPELMKVIQRKTRVDNVIRNTTGKRNF